MFPFLSALATNINAKLVEIRVPVELEWRAIEATEEAQYEYKAVEYAARVTGLLPPVAVLAGGSGSGQLTGLDGFFRWWHRVWLRGV